MQLSRGLLTVAGVALIIAILISFFMMRAGGGRQPDNGPPQRHMGRTSNYTTRDNGDVSWNRRTGYRYSRQEAPLHAFLPRQGTPNGGNGSGYLQQGYQRFYENRYGMGGNYQYQQQPIHLVAMGNGMFGAAPPNYAPYPGQQGMLPYADQLLIPLPMGFQGAPPHNPEEFNNNFAPPPPPQNPPFQLFVNPNVAPINKVFDNGDGYIEVHGQQGVYGSDLRKKNLNLNGAGSSVMPSVHDEMPPPSVPVPASLNAYQFNGLNFPIIPRTSLCQQDKKDYDEMIESITRRIQQFFGERVDLWEKCDNRSRLVCDDEDLFNDEKTEKKSSKQGSSTKLATPAMAHVVPSDASSHKTHHARKAKSPSIFQKKINFNTLLDDLDKKSSITLDFSKSEVAQLYHLLQSQQEVTIVMLAEFPADRSLVGDDVGEPDRPEVPDDSADEADLPPTSFDNSEDELPTVDSAGSSEAGPRPSRLSGFTDNTGTPNRGRSASNLGASSYARIYHAHVWNEYNQNSEHPVSQPTHRRLPEIPREYLEAETAAQNSPATPPPSVQSERRTLPPTPYRRRHQSHDSGIRNLERLPPWMNEHPYLRFLVPTEEAFMTRVPFPPYRIPLIGTARREPGQPTRPQRILPAHENFAQFRMRVVTLLDNEERVNTRGTGALCLEPRDLCFPTSADRGALLRRRQDAEVDEAARLNGEPVLPGQKLPKNEKNEHDQDREGK